MNLINQNLLSKSVLIYYGPNMHQSNTTSGRPHINKRFDARQDRAKGERVHDGRTRGAIKPPH